MKLANNSGPDISKPVYRRKNGIWPCPHTNIVRQIYPADRTSRIDEEFGGSRNVFPTLAGFRMQHSVLADGVSVRVRKQWKRIPSRPAELLRLRGRIYAYPHYGNSTRLELVQVMLKTPQLGVAEGSPVSAIENEHEPPMILQKIRGGDWLSIGIEQHECRCLLANG